MESPDTASVPLTYYCDAMRHLICVPYTVENLHRMARELGIKRCWFHNSKGHPPLRHPQAPCGRDPGPVYRGLAS